MKKWLSAILAVWFLGFWYQAYGLRLLYNSPPGEIAKYKVIIQGTGTTSVGKEALQQQQFYTEYLYIRKVEAINPDGTLTVTFSFSPRKFILNGQEQSMPLQMQPITKRITRSGRVVSSSLRRSGQITVPAAQGLDLSFMFDSVADLGFPEEEIRIGDRWETKIPLMATGLEQPPILKATSLLEALEPYGRVTCARVRSAVDMLPVIGMVTQLLMPNVPYKGRAILDLTSYYEINTAKLLKQTGAMTADIVWTFTLPSLGAMGEEGEGVASMQTTNINLKMNITINTKVL